LSETNGAIPDVDAAELAERLRALRSRFVEFRGRL
jgi:hypothetical protein